MNLIVAVSSNWGIGKNGDLLFRISNDLKRFRRMTLGKIVIMGYNTFMSLPGGRPLKERRNIVLSRKEGLTIPDVEVCGSADDSLALLKNVDPGDIFIIGGEAIYNAFIDRCTQAYVTKIDATPIADVYMPNLDEIADWVLESESEGMEDEGLGYRYCIYRRRIGETVDK